jgi:hypothetical protein
MSPALRSVIDAALVLVIPAAAGAIYRRLGKVGESIDRHDATVREAHGLPARHCFDDQRHRHGAKRPSEK